VIIFLKYVIFDSESLFMNPSKTKNLLIYGAYGYTGKLILNLCKEQNISPVVAGRDPEKTKAIGDAFGFEYISFDLTDVATIAQHIAPFKVVLHCAGPFMYTAEPMIDACIQTKTHYLDITGEIMIFELCAQRDEAFKKAGICAIPGVGFDVVPSDCMAAHVKKLLPDATKLTLAIYSKGGVSKGTALTMAENLDKGGAVRQNGKIKVVPPVYKIKKFDFDGEIKECVTIPWGDVSTAYHSTQIPDIEVFMGLPKSAMKMLKINRFISFIYRFEFVKNFLRKKIKSGKEGPSDTSRARSVTKIIAIAENQQNDIAKSILTGPDGYDITAATALECAKRIIETPQKPGFHTPSSYFGSDFILQFKGITRKDF